MARTAKITNEQIIEAAQALFRERGLAATTLEIAERAGVSEGTIFRRFESKQKLFEVVMGVPFTPPWVKLIEELPEDEDLAVSLERIGECIVDFFYHLIPITSLRLAQGLAGGQKLINTFDAPPIRGLRAISMFLHKQQELGRLRPCDTEIVARMMIGSLYFYAFAEHSGINNMMPMPRATYIRGVVHTLLHGVAAP